MLKSFFVIALCFGLGTTQQDCDCNVTPYRRRPCARATSVTDEQACRAQGCCWDSRNYFSIFFRVSPCYQRTGLCPTYTCAVEPSQRESCGNWLQFACLRQGCCFSYRGRPNCYRRQDLPSSTLPLLTTTTRPAVNLESSWSRWTFWSVCSNSCSSGTRFRTRVCVTQAGQVTPENCAGEGRETETCNSGLCQEWGNWTEEGICNAPCSRAGQIRISRDCIGRGAIDRRCTQSSRTCAHSSGCNPYWSAWLAWTACSNGACAPGVRTRYRACVHFGVSVNVARCTSARNNAQIRAEISETQQCFRHMCPTWTAWSGFLECSRTCVNPGELSVTVSRRQCARGRAERPANRREEAEFDACSRISQTCLSIPCTEAERFEVQTSAGIPSTISPQPPTTYTTPTTTTTRNVEAPGSTTAPPTPRTGTVSWGEWSDCSRSCGPGRSLRIRICRDANGTRTDNAQACRVTSAIQRRPCNTNLCEAWSQWVTSECRGNCVDPNERFGVRSRRRICNSNAQALGSRRCHDVITNCQNITSCTGAVTATTTTTDAPTRPATAALTFTEWGEWTRCSRACGSGFRNRTRTCVPPRTCPTGTQIERCNALPCVETTLVASTTTTEEPTTSISSTSAPTTANSPSTATTIANTALSTEAQTSLLSTPRTASFSWGQWSSCSRTCGPGVSVRVLMCLDESGFIADSDDACDGNSAIERRACNTDLCDSWTEWAPSECIGSCLEPDERFGVQERKRSCSNPSQNMGSPECYDVLTPCLNPTTCAASQTAEPTTKINTPTSTTEAPTPATEATTLATEASTSTTEAPTPATEATTLATEASTSTTEAPTSATEATTLATEASTPMTKTPTSMTETSTPTTETPAPATEATTLATEAITTTMITETPTTTNASIPLLVWGAWGSWSSCSQSCEIGQRTRSRDCVLPLQCQETERDIDLCNTDLCNDWTSWATTSCVGVCGEGVSTRERRCRRNMRLGPPECSRRIETCNLQPCDKNVDFLFLVDSSDYVDDCRALRRNNFSTPVTSLFINEENTPVYARMKSFMDEFVAEWRSVEDDKSHVSIQLFSRACSINTARNLYVSKNLSEPHQSFSETYVDPLPYICGGFYLDWALRCSMDKVLTSSRGDRQNVPNVLVALLSRVPTFSRPSPLLLSALSQQLKQSGTTVIAAGITPLSKLTTEAAKRGYENMLRTLACSGQEDCPTYIGSIWENGNGSPADRIRAALRSAGVL